METDLARKALEQARAVHLAGRLGEAEGLYRRALELDGRMHGAWHGLGMIALQVQKPARAAEFYREALGLDSNRPEYWANFGEALRQEGRLEESVGALTKACRMAPGNPDAAYNLARTFLDQREYGMARLALLRVLEINPGDHEAVNNLGVALQNMGMSDLALEQFARAMRQTSDLIPRGNFVQMHNYLPFSRREIAQAHRALGREIESRWPRVTLAPRGRHERLRVGYLSSCFQNHATARFLIGALRGHDHSRFEIFAYSFGRKQDDMTQRARGLVDQWRDIGGIGDDEAAARILADEIDILVDIDGYTSDNRIAILARKPAPVVVSWLGYQNTTGMSAVDYRITDGWVDPLGLTDEDYTEKLMRLEGAFYCYEPPSENISPEFRGDSPFTFGSVNNLMKISTRVLETWAEILARTGAKLVMVLTGRANNPAYQPLLAPFAARGAADRVELLGRLSYGDYLKTLGRIDVSLDPFPCVGHTTTCDALWMGSAVLTMAGEDYRSRLGVSVLSNLGLEQWIARDAGEYVEKAMRLAKQPQELRAGRLGMRKRMLESALCDTKRFAGRLEAAYLKMCGRE